MHNLMSLNRRKQGGSSTNTTSPPTWANMSQHGVTCGIFHQVLVQPRIVQSTSVGKQVSVSLATKHTQQHRETCTRWHKRICRGKHKIPTRGDPLVVVICQWQAGRPQRRQVLRPCQRRKRPGTPGAVKARGVRGGWQNHSRQPQDSNNIFSSWGKHWPSSFQLGSAAGEDICVWETVVVRLQDFICAWAKQNTNRNQQNTMQINLLAVYQNYISWTCQAGIQAELVWSSTELY